MLATLGDQVPNLKRSRLLEFGEYLHSIEPKIWAKAGTLAWLELLGELELTDLFLEDTLGVPASFRESCEAELSIRPDVVQQASSCFVHKSILDRTSRYIAALLQDQASQQEDAWLVEAAVVQRVRHMARPDTAKLAIKQLLKEKQVVALNGMLAVASEKTVLSKKQRAKMSEMLRLFEGNPTPPNSKELATQLHLSSDAVTSLLRHATQQKLLIDLQAGLHIQSRFLTRCLPS